VSTIAAVVAGGIGLVAALFHLRFCGAIDMPRKPAKPAFTDAPEVVAKERDESREGYRQALEADALKAGLPKPTVDDMERAFAWRTSSDRFSIAPGKPAKEVAGLRVSAITTRREGSEPLLALVIENPGPSPVAYVVDTRVSTGAAGCQNRTLLPFNGNVIAAGGKETRSECAWKRGLDLYVDRIESAEITPMHAYYLSQVPPQALGVSDRIGSGHKPKLPPGVVPCNVAMAQSTMRALEDGKTHWRDLADYYARHPCQTFQFPDGYHAFTKDAEQSLPVTGE
jgi:hypothetical protein